MDNVYVTTDYNGCEPAEETGTLKELTVKPGDVVECVQSIFKWWTEGNLYVITKDGTPADNSGSTYGDCKDPQPAVKFRIISRASDREEMKQLIDDAADDIQDVLDRLAEYDTPKTSSPEGGADYLLWSDMTDEDGWRVCSYDDWQELDMTKYEAREIPGLDAFAYRVRPEPKRDTVKLVGFIHNNEWFFRERDARATHRITFDTLDGKPDYNSIKMEPIND